jgi:hypothetical protein
VTGAQQRNPNGMENLEADTMRDSQLLASGASITVIGQGPAAPAGSVVIHVDPPLIGTCFSKVLFINNAFT